MTGRGEVILRHAEPVMGTVVSFDVRPRGLAYERTRAALARACTILHRADDVFSLYRPDTPLHRLRRGELSIGQGPPELAEVLALCERAGELSDGWFDAWTEDGVDPTGLVKGWAARQAAAVLCEADVGAAMVNAAGDIAVFGRPGAERGWRVGIRSPAAADRLLCVVAPAAAVATSGRYERGDHIRNPRTGAPAAGVVSATVCGPDLAIADALATGLVAAGECGLEAVQRAGYGALLVDAKGFQRRTAGFPVVD